MTATATQPEVRMVRTTDLRPNPLNPRSELNPTGLEELAASIQAQGILQPLLATPDGVLVAGHRRLAAARLAGRTEVPVIFHDLNETEQLAVLIVENLQREDLSPLEEARAYQALKDRGGLIWADVARRVGVHPSRIHERVPILQLLPEVQAMYARRELPTTLAKSLAKVTDEHQQRRFANIAARRQMTSPQLEELIKRGIGELSTRAERRKVEPPPPPPGLSVTRKEGLDRLLAEAEASVSFADLARAFEAVCCWCGMETSPEVCRECPLPQLLNRILEVA